MIHLDATFKCNVSKCRRVHRATLQLMFTPYDPIARPTLPDGWFYVENFGLVCPRHDLVFKRRKA